MKSTYSRGSMFHKALEKISRKIMSAEEWKDEVTHKPMSFFQGSVITTMLNDGRVAVKNKMYNITKSGEDYLSELGRVKMRKPQETAGAYLVKTHYDGAELSKAPVRPNAEQFLQLPSRFSNRLVYRNGRVGVV